MRNKKTKAFQTCAEGHKHYTLIRKDLPEYRRPSKIKFVWDRKENCWCMKSGWFDYLTTEELAEILRISKLLNKEGGKDGVRGTRKD